MAAHLGKLARAFDRLAPDDKTYFLRLDLARRPEGLPAEMSVKENRVAGTFVVSASGRKKEILRMLGAAEALKNLELVRCLIRDPEDSLYLSLLADGRLVVDLNPPACPGRLFRSRRTKS
jgi:hypothetical protein